MDGEYLGICGDVMTIGILGLSGGSFRLTDRTHSASVTEAHSVFELTEGESAFRAEQQTVGCGGPPLIRLFKSLICFFGVIWNGFFRRTSIYSGSSPILLSAEIAVKTVRFNEQTLIFTPGAYAADIHDYTAPMLEGGKDFVITPVGYRKDIEEIRRRARENLFERIGASVTLFCIPVLIMLAAMAIPSSTLGMVSIFMAVVLYPMIPLLFIRWRRDYRRFERKVSETVDRLNAILS